MSRLFGEHFQVLLSNLTFLAFHPPQAIRSDLWIIRFFGN